MQHSITLGGILKTNDSLQITQTRRHGVALKDVVVAMLVKCILNSE